MAKTMGVSRIRKNMSKAIEIFATAGTFDNPSVDKGVTNAISSKSSSSSSSNSSSSSSSSSNSRANNQNIAKEKIQSEIEGKFMKTSQLSSDAVKPRTPSKEQSKRQSEEKQKIREQYEAFMNLKKMNDDHEDNQKLQQYTELNSDILTLLSTIKGSSASK